MARALAEVPGAVAAHAYAVVHRWQWMAARRRVFCHRGHRFTRANTYTTPDGRRVCRACQAVRHYRHQTRPDVRECRRLYCLQYNARPEVKAKRRAHRSDQPPCKNSWTPPAGTAQTGMPHGR